jgi:hypothetical protein
MLCGHFRLQGVSRAKLVSSMRSLFIFVAICFSGTVFAQSAPPKVGNTALVQAKPTAPTGLQIRWNSPGHKAMGW